MQQQSITLRKIILGPLMPALYGSGLGWLFYYRSGLDYPSAIFGVLIALIGVYILVETNAPGDDSKRLWAKALATFRNTPQSAGLCLVLGFAGACVVTEASRTLLAGTSFHFLYRILGPVCFLLGSFMLMSAARATIILMLGCGSACYCFIMAMPHRSERTLLVIVGVVALLSSITIAFSIWKSGLKHHPQIEA